MSYPRPSWVTAQAALTDISGTPAIVVNPADDSVYFAFSALGAVGATPDTGNYSIVVGHATGAGTIDWLFRDPQLRSYSPDVQPRLALGLSGELYLAFVTTGAIPGRSNLADVPSLCGSCGSSAGREDIVLARLDGVASGSPTITWRVQDAYIDSCNVETAVQLHFDLVENRLYIAFTSSGATQCNVPVGSQNVVVVCFHPDGYLTWSYQGDLLNGTGVNGPPSITTDNAGGVYVAYTVTAAVAGGAAIQGVQDVEVIRLHAEGAPLRIVRDWILSAVATVNAGGGAVNGDPWIACDGVRGKVYLAFTSTGTVPGGTKTNTGADIVFASLQADTGALNWILQNDTLNEVTYRYSNVSAPMITLDANGALFGSAHAVNQSTGNEMLVMWRINPGTTQSDWYFRTDIANVYRAYVAAASFTAPFSAITATAPFSVPVIGKQSGHLYVGFVQQNMATFYLVGLNEVPNYLDYNAQQYIRSFTSICSSVRR